MGNMIPGRRQKEKPKTHLWRIRFEASGFPFGYALTRKGKTFRNWNFGFRIVKTKNKGKNHNKL